MALVWPFFNITFTFVQYSPHFYYYTLLFRFNSRCEELRPCVECQAYKSGSLDEEACRTKCITFQVELVDKIQEEAEEGTKICRAPDDNGCSIVFEYFYRDKELFVRAQKTKICSEGANVLGKLFNLTIEIRYSCRIN